MIPNEVNANLKTFVFNTKMAALHSPLHLNGMHTTADSTHHSHINIHTSAYHWL